MNYEAGIILFTTFVDLIRIVMLIYHGGYCEIRKPQILRSAYPKDFGQGFYGTNLPKQAERWAKRYESPVVSIYNYTPGAGLTVLTFEEMTEEWLDFIVACRNGEPHEYDIVVGAMANDQIYNYIADYISGVIDREQFWVLAKFKHPTHQMNFCTEKALQCLTFNESRRILR